MKIVTISDTHTKHNKILIPDGDIILFSGDCSGRGSYNDIEKFMYWYSSLPHAYKVMVAGNHDFGFENDPHRFEQLCKDFGVIYLNDTSVNILGINIHGSPITPEFCDWAFNRSRTIEDSMKINKYGKQYSYIGNHWDKIPDNTDILITHGPPYNILDTTVRGDLTGCEVLFRHIHDRLNLKMHVFGHIHEARGVETHHVNSKQPTTFVNTSSLNEYYNPQIDETFVFDWYDVKLGVSIGRDY